MHFIIQRLLRNSSLMSAIVDAAVNRSISVNASPIATKRGTKEYSSHASRG